MGLLSPHLARAAPPPEPVVAAQQATRDAPLATRLEAVTRPLLGVTYALDPEGEGQGVDADPLGRWDAFDCQTFVEAALATALATDPAGIDAVRRALRYGALEPAYGTRRHFIELQWLPGNVRDGLLRETTPAYGPTRALAVHADATTWATWPGRSKLRLSDGELPVGDATLRVLPVADAIASAARIAPGSVVLFAREPRAGVPLLVTHMGVIVAPGVLRHASTTSQRVRDQDLAAYLTRAMAWPGWPVAGVAVYEPVDPWPGATSEDASTP